MLIENVCKIKVVVVVGNVQNGSLHFRYAVNIKRVHVMQVEIQLINYLIWHVNFNYVCILSKLSVLEN